VISCRICEEEKENHYGYKTHITVDAKEDFIQGGYAIYVNVADTKQFEKLISEPTMPEGPTIAADKGYRNERNKTLIYNKYSTV